VRRAGIRILSLIVLTAAATARAQTAAWGVGAAGGVVAAADRDFHFGDFHRSDVNVWVDYAIEEQVRLRGTVGRMNVAAHNAGQEVKEGSFAVLVPESLRDRVDYGLLSVAYEFVEPAWKSGAFAGVGAYHVRPGDPGGVAAVGADRSETVWGVHVGLDAEVTVWRGLGVVGRVAVHIPQTDPHRVLVAADAGLAYRF